MADDSITTNVPTAQVEIDGRVWRVDATPGDMRIIDPDGTTIFRGRDARTVLTHFAMCVAQIRQLHEALSAVYHHGIRLNRPDWIRDDGTETAMCSKVEAALGVERVE